MIDRSPAALAGDQLTSAIRAARAVAGRLAAEPDTVALPHVLGPWGSARMLSVQTPHGRMRCDHLRTVQVQPVIVPAPSILVCEDCFEARRHGEAPFAACPGCERPIIRSGPLRPVVAQEGMFVLRGLLCRRCVATEHDR